MWPFKGKARQRRVEVRKGAAAPGGSRWQRFRGAGGLAAAPVAVAFFVCAALMDLWTVDPFPYRLNQYVPADIYPRVRFPLYPTALIEEAERNARSSTPATFGLDEQFVKEVITTLQDLPGHVKPPSTQPASQPTQPTSRPATRPVPTPAPAFQVDEPTREQFDLKGDELAAWAKLAPQAQRLKHIEQVNRLRERLVRVYTVSAAAAGEQKYARKATEFLIHEAGKPRSEKLDAMISLADESRIAGVVPALAESFAPAIRRNIEYYLLRTLKSRPLYTYDADLTVKDIQRAVDAINANPPVKEIRPDDCLVHASRRRGPSGEQIVVGLRAEHLELLRKEHQAYYQQELAGNPLRLWGRVLGRGFILLLATLLTCAYVARYRPEIVRRPARAFILAAMLLLMLAIVRTMVFVLEWNLYTVTLPVLMAAIVLAIAYDQRFAIAMGATLSFFAVYQIRADFSMLVVLLAGVTAGVFVLREVRTRGKLIMVSGIAADAVFAGVWACGFAADVPAQFSLRDSLWGASFALLVGFLVWGILPVIERILGVATSMTLLEWSDASKPLLKRLAMEAPGTYNHSLQLASVCESAAEAIGARGLLARVGAYYHDVGKLNKPEYFTENQAGGTSKHEKLSPAMSLLIITGHVKDGLELAREYGLPKVLHEFVATHHGTTLVQYFYHQAAEQRKNGADRAPDEVEFRYHGPKPQSKEAAILLLADAAESSLRSVAEPTPGRIENQVHTMVNRRLMDGQLDECELKLQEVHQIEASLVRSLCSIYHSRVAYPTPAGERPSAAELRPKPPKPAEPEKV